MTFNPFASASVAQMLGVPEGVALTGISFNSLFRSQITGSVSSLTSGVASGHTIEVPAGYTLKNLGFMSGGQAAVGPLHWWLALITPANSTVIGVTADQTTTAIGTFAVNTVPMTAPVVVPGSSTVLTRLWVAVMVATSSTVCNTEGAGSPGASTTAPVQIFTFGSGLTTPPLIGSTITVTGAPAAQPLVWAD